jgi:hypothetical protein
MTTTSPICEPTGRQVPHYESAFEGNEADGERAVKLATRAGLRPMPWQRQALGRILSRRPDGSFTHPDCVLLSPRQSGKSEILVWRLLFGLFVIGERQVYSAQRFVTADSVYRRMKATIESRPSLYRRLLKPPTSSSSRATIELSNGATVQLGVRSGDLGRGLDAVSLVIFDEGYNLREPEVSALAGAQLSSHNNQMIYASTAPVFDQQPNCRVLSDMRKLGLQKQPDLYFAEFCAEEGMPVDDPATWAYANPSYGLLAKQRDIARLYAKAKTPDSLALFKADVLGLGEYPPDESELGSVISAETWAALAADTPPELVGPIAIAVDRSNDRKTWAIASAQRTVEGQIHLEVGPYEDLSTNADVVEKLIDIVCDWDPVEVAIDQRSAAAVIQPALEAVDIEPHMTNTTELVRACGSWLDAVEAGGISHSDQPVLNDAVVSAIKRDLAGRFAWDRAPGVTQLVAVSLAAWSLISATQDIPKHPPPPPMFTQPDYGSSYDNVVELDLMNAKF